jgi:hypothetical protein
LPGDIRSAEGAIALTQQPGMKFYEGTWELEGSALFTLAMHAFDKQNFVIRADRLFAEHPEGDFLDRKRAQLSIRLIEGGT